MSKISSARPRPTAVFAALVLRRGVVMFVTVAIAFPALVFVGPRNARTANRERPVESLPPERFHMSRGGDSLTALWSAAGAAANGVLSMLTSSPRASAGGNSVGEDLTAEVTNRPAAEAGGSDMSAALPPTGAVDFDFDGDGKSDIGRWRSQTNEFTVRNSGSGMSSTYPIGSSSSIAVPGDFDGDGRTDAAVFNAGMWTIRRSSDGAAQTIMLGASGDKPVSADYDGDGTTDAAVFRSGTWLIRQSTTGNTISTAFGLSNDVPITGNFDGDSLADIAVYRRSTGTWYVQRTTAGLLQCAWGLASDTPVASDFDGDNMTDLAVYRPTTGTWWILKSSTNFTAHAMHNWGSYGDQPVPADYDGDNRSDFAVWRPKTGVWYISKSSTANQTHEYHGLGAAGDTAVPSAYIAQVGVSVYGDEMAAARLSPKNATGSTDLYSRNFSWGTSLVGLPGRAGLNAGFGISYNSLVWTKLDNAMHFDVDGSNVSPGFRFGFPTIERAYYDDARAVWAYLMVTPSGGRVEFRQTAASGTYETADSSYAQLVTKGAESPNDPVDDISITVRGTDGSMMSYEWKAGAFRASQIKDRNGNFISIVHDDQGLLRTVTDTLQRVVTVSYDEQLNPTTITQTWKTNNGQGSNVTHTWAAFGYTTINIDTNFDASLAVVGPPSGTTLKVLERVTFPDGSSTRFTHNSYAQVANVQSFAADNHELNRVRTNLETPASNQLDCPRFTETRTFVENFNGGNETVVTNTLASGVEAVDIDGATIPASII